MDDEALWKRRFLLFTAVRLLGVLLFVAGMGLAFADWLRPGGMPQVGIPVMLAGLADAVLAPRMLKRLWRDQDRA